MIGQIIKLAQSDDFYNVSETVEVAKGKYKLISTFKELKKQAKRTWQAKNIRSK